MAMTFDRQEPGRDAGHDAGPEPLRAVAGLLCLTTGLVGVIISALAWHGATTPLAMLFLPWSVFCALGGCWLTLRARGG